MTFASEIFTAVLNMSITGSLIICAVMLIRLCLKRLPRKFSYALWLIPAVRLLCPVAVSSAVSLFNLFGAAANAPVEYLSQQTAQTEAAVTETAEMFTTIYVPEDAPAPVTTSETSEPLKPEVTAEAEAAEKSDPQKVLNLLSLLWMTAAVGIVIYSVGTYIRVHLMVRTAQKAEGYYIAPNIESPFVFGTVRPRIYVPDGVSEADLDCILAHENAHIKRFDHIVKLFCVPVLALHWFNPLVWLGVRLMTADMELSCDELALRNSDGSYKKAYANALLNMSMRQNKLTIGSVLSFGESNIKSRIKGVLSMKKPKLAAVIAAVVVIAAAALCLLTSAKGSDAPKMKGYRSYEIVSDTAVRLCTPDEISNALDEFNAVALEETEFSGYREFPQEIRMFKSEDGSGKYSSMTFFYSDGETYVEYVKNAGTKSGDDYLPNENPKSKIYLITDDNYGSYDFVSEAYHTFTGTVTQVTAGSDLYIVEGDEGGFPEGEVFVTSEEQLEYGDRVEVCFKGGVMTSAPLQIDQIWCKKIGDGDGEYTGRDRAVWNGVEIPDMSAAGELTPEQFREQTFVQLDLDEETASGCRFTLVGYGVYSMGSSESIYAYGGRIECMDGDGGYAAVEVVLPDSGEPYELKTEEIADLMTVYEMDGQPLVAFKYGGKMTFLTIVDDESDILDNKKFQAFAVDDHSVGTIVVDTETGTLTQTDGISYSTVNCSGGKLTADTEQNMIIDGDGHTAYVFDFGTLTMETKKAFLDPVSAVEDYLNEQTDAVSVDIESIRIPQSSGDLALRYLNNGGFENRADVVIVYAEFDAEFFPSSSKMSGHYSECFAVTAVDPPEDRVGFSVFDSFPYEPHSFTGTVAEMYEDGSFIVTPDMGTPERDISARIPIHSVTMPDTPPESVGERVTITYNGDLTVSADGAVIELLSVQAESGSRTAPTRNYTSYSTVQRIGHVTEDGGIDFIDDSGSAEISLDLPSDWDFRDGWAADKNGVKVFEIGALCPDTEKINTEEMKTDQVSGREITVYEEDTDGGDLYSYMVHKSVPDIYSENGVYECYNYIVDRGGYSLIVSFVVNSEYYDESVSRDVLRSINIKAAESPTDPNVYTPYRLIVQVGHVAENGGVSYSPEDSYAELTFSLPEDWIFNGSSVADKNGKKVFEIGAVTPDTEDRDAGTRGKAGTVIENEMGRDVTIHEESTDGGDLYKYMCHSSVPDYYSENYVYESYDYTVDRGGYSIFAGFIVSEYYDEEICRRVLESIDIKTFDIESVDYSGVEFSASCSENVLDVTLKNNSEHGLELRLVNRIYKLENGEYVPLGTIGDMEIPFEYIELAPGKDYSYTENIGEYYGKLAEGSYRIEVTGNYDYIQGVHTHSIFADFEV